MKTMFAASAPGRRPDGTPARPFTGRHMLMAFLGFFGVIIAVNMVMAWLAVTTFSGTVTDDAYIKGRAYNRTLEAARAQNALGWTVALDARPAGVEGTMNAGAMDLAADGGRQTLLTARFVDRSGQPVNLLDVTATLKRPARKDLDHSITLKAIGGGLYRAGVVLPLAGRWQVDLTALGDGDTVFLERHEIWRDDPAAPARTTP